MEIKSKMLEKAILYLLTKKGKDGGRLLPQNKYLQKVCFDILDEKWNNDKNKLKRWTFGELNSFFTVLKDDFLQSDINFMIDIQRGRLVDLQVVNTSRLKMDSTGFYIYICFDETTFPADKQKIKTIKSLFDNEIYEDLSTQFSCYGLDCGDDVEKLVAKIESILKNVFSYSQNESLYISVYKQGDSSHSNSGQN